MLTCTCTHTHTHTHTTQSQDVQLIATFTGGFPLAISHTFNIPANVLKLNMIFFPCSCMVVHVQVIRMPTYTVHTTSTKNATKQQCGYSTIFPYCIQYLLSDLLTVIFANKHNNSFVLLLM